MAFANLFVGLNSTRQDDKTFNKTSESSLQDRREEELMPADQLKRKDKIPLRKRQIEPSSLHSGPPKRTKGTQQKPWKINGKRTEVHKTLAYRDFDSEAKDYHVVKFDYEKSRMDFNKELDLYSQSNSNNKNTSVKGNDKTKEQKKNGNNSQQNQQSQAKRGQKKRSRDFSVKDHSLSMTGRDWVGRNQVRANGDQYVKHSRMDGCRIDQRANIQRSSQSQRGGKQFHGMRRQFKQDIFVKQKRTMTQEFRDQNVLDVDGRSICRHFLLGKCIKGSDCQLEHPPVVQDMIKEVCKFYVQGFCSKECCPYMHKTFPCKFYHAKGKCFQADGCRFSHEPLTDLTSKLLEGALQRDKEQTKDQPTDVHQPVSTEESLTTDQTENSPGKPKPLYDIQFNRLRPNFYNSSCPSELPSDEVTTPLSKAEELTNLIEKDALPPTADSMMSLNNPSSTHGSKELVSYSVEAVLSQIPEPFSNLFSSSITQVSSEHAILQRVPPNPSSFSDHKDVPYSDDVLGSKKSQENSLRGVFTGPISKVYASRHPAKSHFEVPRTLFCPQANTDLPSSSANRIRNVSHSLHESRTSAETPFKCLFAGPPVGQSPFHLPSTKERHDPPEPEFKSVAGTLEVLKPTKKPFDRLFAGLVSQSLDHKQDSLQSIEPTPSPADFNRTVGLGMSIETPSHNNFARPIGKTCSPQPCIEQKKANIFKNKDLGRLEPAQSAIHNSRNKDCQISDPHTVRPLHGPFQNLFAGLSSQNLTTTLPKSMSPDHPPPTSKKKEVSDSVEGMNGSGKAPDKPFRSLFAAPIEEFSTRVPLTKPNPTNFLEKQRMPESSINLSSSKPTETNSILTTLFCRLRPCHPERANEIKNLSSNLTENSSLDSNEGARKDTICTFQDQPCVGEERDTKRTEGEDKLKRNKMEEELRLDGLNKNLLMSPVESSPFGPDRPPLLQPDLLLALHEPSSSSTPSAPRNLCVKRAVGDPLPAEEQQASSRVAGTTVQLASPGLHNLPVQSMALMRRSQSKLAPKKQSGPTSCTSRVNENKLKNLFKTFDPTASPFGQ